jgi:SAM-dependent methyltransferase
MKTYSYNDLLNLYQNKVKKDSSYFTKYQNLDPYKDGKIEEMLNGKDYPRVTCVLDFKEWISKYNIVPEKMLYTSDTDFELNYIQPKSKELLEYDSTTNHGDLHSLSLKDKDYDFVLFSQTIEHLYNPFKAIEKIYEHTKSGGFVFTSVPTINIPHMTPIHFAGIYPMGLAVMFESAGFEIMEIGQWGNINYLNYIFHHHGWPDHQYLTQIANAQLRGSPHFQTYNGLIANEEVNIAQCWCLARKN